MQMFFHWMSLVSTAPPQWKNKEDREVEVKADGEGIERRAVTKKR